MHIAARTRLRAHLAFALALSLGTLVSAPLDAQRAVAAPALSSASLDSYIQHAVTDWGIAGLAIAIVHDDSVVYERGFGVREAGKPDRVDARTLFAIGSNSKLFTATLAGMMVDAKKMSWDAPATTYLPSFQLYDPWVTREITLRDLLSHRSGLGRRGDMLWYASPFDRAEVLRRIRYLRPNSSFRSQYGYQNIMVLAAGEATAAAAGRSWDDLVKERIFQPLGMRASNTSVRDLAGQTDVATPHLLDKGTLTPVPWRNIDNIGPAGSINSNVEDMAKWLRFLLDSGKVGDRQLIAASTLREISSPQTIIPSPDDTLSPSTHFHAYGLGVGMYDLLGVKVMSHTGGIDGMLSQVTWVPERHFGFVILTNTEGHNNVFAAVGRRILDSYLDAPPRDWSAIMLAQTNKQEAAQAQATQRLEASRPKDATPSVPVDRYAGHYSNEMYGDVNVDVAAADKIVLQYGAGRVGDLEPWSRDAYKIVWRGKREGSGLVQFIVDPIGTVRSLRLYESLTPAAFRSPDVDEFRKVAPATAAAVGARH